MVSIGTDNLVVMAAPMTPEEKAANVALLARVVMKWPEYETIQDPQPDYEYFVVLYSLESTLGDSEEPGAVHVVRPSGPAFTQWNPYTSVADAMEMLDRFPEVKLRKIHDMWHCTVFKDWIIIGTEMRGYFHGDDPDTKDAICAACLEWARAQGEMT